MKPNLPASNSLEELLHIVSNPEVFQARVTELKALNLQLAQRLSDLGVVDEINTMSLRAQAKLDEAKTIREEADKYASGVRDRADVYSLEKSATLSSREEKVYATEKELDSYDADLRARKTSLDGREAKLNQQETHLAQQAEQLKVQQSELSQKRTYLETGIKKLQDFIANG